MGGDLPCKRIIFRPWKPQSKQPEILKRTIDTFVTSVITYAIQQHLTTIGKYVLIYEMIKTNSILAFPSIGCGQLGNDPKQIAQYMIGETYRHLKSSVKFPLTVSFVLMPDQNDAYDAFVDQLNLTTQDDDMPTDLDFDKQSTPIVMNNSRMKFSF